MTQKVLSVFKQICQSQHDWIVHLYVTMKRLAIRSWQISILVCLLRIPHVNINFIPFFTIGFLQLFNVTFWNLQLVYMHLYFLWFFENQASMVFQTFHSLLLLEAELHFYFLSWFVSFVALSMKCQHPSQWLCAHLIYLPDS